MPRCNRCGKYGDVKEIKLCPIKDSSFHNKKICIDCYKELKAGKEELEEGKFHYNFPTPKEEVIASVPKKYKYISLGIFISIIAVGLIVAFYLGIFGFLYEVDKEEALIGTWQLQDMPGIADDLYTQTWRFYKDNHTLIVKTDYEDEDNDDIINNLYWEIFDEKIKFEVTYSNQDQKLIYNVHLDEYEIEIEKNSKITLTYEKDIINPTMTLEKIKEKE